MAYRKQKSYLDDYTDPADRRQERREERLAFWGRVLSPRNLKHAFKSVLGGFREYVPFFAALLIVQCLFWAVVINADSRAETLRHEAFDHCTYDISVEGLTSDEWSSFFNRNFMIKDNLSPSARGYESYEAETYEDILGKKHVQVHIALPEGGSAEEFFSRYKFEGENVRVRYSERITYADDVRSYRTVEWLLIAAVGLLSVVIILILFLIRTNHYKFCYGIYMSFGAGFERLFLTAAYEMIAIALLTFLPALGLSCGLGALIFGKSGGLFSLAGWNLPICLGWTVAVVLLAVAPSVRILASKTPVSMLVAADNANLVASPKRSFRIFRKSFPLHYELYGFWRFRAYYAGLLASAVLFTTLFLTGLFLSDMVQTTEDFLDPQFVLTAGKEAIDSAEAGTILDQYPEAGAVTWEASVEAVEINGHVVLTRRQGSGISGMTVDAQQKGMKADNNFKYMAVNDELCSNAVEHGVWVVEEGDLSSIFSDELTVAVTEKIANRKMLDFKVGDKIILGIYKDYKRSIRIEKPDKKYILKKQIPNYEYDFLEVTIGAVVDTGDTDNSYSILLPEQFYTEVTKKTPKITQMNVYLLDPTDHAGAEQLYVSLRELMSFYDEGEVRMTNEDFTQAASGKVAAKLPTVLGSATLLIISAVVWLLSQSNFSRKREKENFMLSAFGARDSELKKLYLLSGAFLAAAASVTTALLSSLLNYLIYSFINHYLINMKFITGVRYEYSVSWWGLLLCVLLSGACALASTYLPLLRYLRERDQRLEVRPAVTSGKAGN